MKLYVVTAPPSIRRIYNTWDACRVAVSGVSGAQFQAVRSQAQAEALLSGEAVLLPPGQYAFVDGNHLGGVGVVLVSQTPEGDHAAHEISTSVAWVFARADIRSLGSDDAVADALARLRNVLAELAGLYQALLMVPAGDAVTIVHDYEGVGAWLTGAWKAKDPTVREIVEGCHRLIAAKQLAVTFQHQAGHQSTFAGRNDFALYNRRADELATAATR